MITSNFEIYTAWKKAEPDTLTAQQLLLIRLVRQENIRRTAIAQAQRVN